MEKSIDHKSSGVIKEGTSEKEFDKKIEKEISQTKQVDEKK